MEAGPQERLYFLTEEACEVGKIAQKINRFGMAATHPDAPDISNREHLEAECADSLYVMEMLIHAGTLRLEKLCDGMRSKFRKLKKYARHQSIYDFPEPCTILLASPPEAQIPRPSLLQSALMDIREILQSRHGISSHCKLDIEFTGAKCTISASMNGRNIGGAFEAETLEKAIFFMLERVTDSGGVFEAPPVRFDRIME